MTFTLAPVAHVPDTPSPLPGVDEWATSALAELGRLPHVGRVGVALLEGGGRQMLFTATERRRDAGAGWCHIDAYSSVPLNDTIRNLRPVAASLTDLHPRYEAFVAAQDGTGFVAVATVPLSADGRVLGGFVLYYTHPQRFDTDQLAQLGVTADEIAVRLRAALPQPLPDAGAYEAPVGTASATHDIPPDPAAVAEARRFLNRRLDDWGIDDEIASQAVLCLSELVTNALIHTTGGCHVQVELHEGELLTRVRDNGLTASPRTTPTDEPLRGEGHGLLLVDALATRWGRTTDAGGATAWFSLVVP